MSSIRETTHPALPAPPADNAPDSEWNAYISQVQAATVKHVPLLLPIEAARDALRACKYVLAIANVFDHLRVAAEHLDAAIQDRQDTNGQELFADALADLPTTTNEQRIRWLRVVCAEQYRELAELREARS